MSSLLKLAPAKMTKRDLKQKTTLVCILNKTERANHLSSVTLAQISKPDTLVAGPPKGAGLQLTMSQLGHEKRL